ncbi:hypothetical protein MMC14_008463 [Varicellaria rhodocarpa]|nr:hypothetical protein [Varicellaria rhodocarpa]
MSNAVATIVNPLSKKETLLFSIAGDKRQLAMSSFSLDEIGTVYPYSDNGVLMGSLATPGALAAVVRRGLVTVYGFTRSTADSRDGNTKPPSSSGGAASSGAVEKVGDLAGTDASPKLDKNLVISQIIPFPNPVAKDSELQTPYVGFAAISDGEDHSWLYNLKQVKLGRDPVLQETELQHGQEHETHSLGVNPTDTSKLAALHIPKTKQRLVFYQRETSVGKPIQVISIDSKGKGDPVTIPGTTNAYPGTPLATTYRDNNGAYTLYLYYFTQNLELCRAISSGGGWTNATLVTDEPTALVSSQLAATIDTNNNYVFYIDNDSPKKGYRKHIDPLM